MQYKLLVLVGALVGAPGRVHSAPTSQVALEQRLVRALGHQDPARLERAARRLGLAGLIRALDGRRPRPVRWAVLEAAPHVDRPWLLLPHLLKVMRDGRDRAMASRAAAATLAIAEELRLPSLDQTEEVPALMLAHGRAVARLAADRRVALDIRVQALLALAHLGNVTPGRRHEPLLGFLADPEPRIREAAVELFAAGAPREVLKRLARVAAEDASMQVARAAAVALCARVQRRRSSVAPELAVLRAARAYPRIRQMVESLDATDDQLVDLARCLVRSRAVEDRRALAELRRRSSRLRRLLRRPR